MIDDNRKWERIIFLLTGLSTSVVFASQPTSMITTPSKDSPSHQATAAKTTSVGPSLTALRNGHAVVQLGGYWGIQGEAQHIDIAGLIGNTYTVTDRHDGNVLAGLGYFVSGQDKGLFSMSYGINGFYLARTSVSGNVIQEDLFTNLSYRYHLTHFPVYAMAKSTIPLTSGKTALTIDAGIGPNFMRASGYQEQSLDGGVTLPDNAFSSHTTTTFSATAGIGLMMNNVFGSVPLECGYRFFYLGEGRFNANTDQLLNTLHTGNTYANALLCSVSV